MISLNITGDNAEDFASQVHGFMALLAGTSTVAIASGGTAKADDTKPTRKARETKATDPTGSATGEASAPSSANAASAPEAADPALAALTSNGATPSTGSTSTAQLSDADATDLAKVKARAVPYSQTAGGPALQEILIQAGSATGNFSGLADDPAKIKLVSDALAAMGY